MQIRKPQIILNAFFWLVVIACLLPFALLVMASITDEEEILRSGYSLFPKLFSFESYAYLFKNFISILRAYGVTFFITIVGTSASLLITALLAYPLSRKEFALRKPMTFFVFFTMLFSGGLVPTYILYTQYLHFKNTLFALIIPILLMRAFYVLLMRTFFATSIPDTILESARIDGAGEWRIFFQIVVKLSYPVLATVGLFQAVNFWNDWFNGMIFITDKKLYSVQNLLNRILLDIQFLASNQLAGAYDSSVQVPLESVRMSLAVVGIVPIFIAYPFFQKYFVKGLTVGAVKG